MLCYLDNYGADEFASVYLGQFETPEVSVQSGSCSCLGRARYHSETKQSLLCGLLLRMTFVSGIASWGGDLVPQQTACSVTILERANAV